MNLVGKKNTSTYLDSYPKSNQKNDKEKTLTFPKAATNCP